MTPSDLTSEQFREWRAKTGMSQSAAARRLGISHSSVHGYESGTRKEGKVKIPLLVTLGMAAILHNIQPYNGEIE